MNQLTILDTFPEEQQKEWRAKAPLWIRRSTSYSAMMPEHLSSKHEEILVDFSTDLGHWVIRDIRPRVVI